MSRLTFKRQIGKIWPGVSGSRKIILLYHSVGNSLWGMNVQKFLDQINWLTDSCQVLSLSDLLQAKTNETLQVALTFDDGYQSLYDNVAPVLSHKKINAMVYLNTGWISETSKVRKASEAELGHYPKEYFLTWEEVMELHRKGWEIGSHGVNHYNFASLGETILNQELSTSKKDIERRLNIPCLHFSYPWGKHSVRVKNAAKQHGYKYAVGTQHGAISSRSDIWSLPRINIEKNYTLADFKNILKGKWDYLGIIHKMRGQ